MTSSSAQSSTSMPTYLSSVAGLVARSDFTLKAASGAAARDHGRSGIGARTSRRERQRDRDDQQQSPPPREDTPLQSLQDLEAIAKKINDRTTSAGQLSGKGMSLNLCNNELPLIAVSGRGPRMLTVSTLGK